MTALSPCPTEHQLEQLLHGLLPDAESEPLEQHLLGCEACQLRTRELNSSDTLVAVIRGRNLLPIDWSQKALLSGLSERLRDRSQLVTQVTSLNATQVSQHEPALDLTDFIMSLRPAEAVDELGRLGGFRLLKLLGHGGMGAVFLAEDVRLKRRVALKVLRPEFAQKKDAAERFLREAQAAATVRHDNVVTIFQVGEDNGTPFMAQELLHGESLHDRLHRERTLPIDDVLNIGRQIADGLAAAHAHGLLHRDIKPANVWLESSPVAPRQESRCETDIAESSSILGATDAARRIGSPLAEREGYVERQGDARVKILDFGLARLERSDTQLTGSGMILGTPAYMSPEQADGHEVDARTDLFSLGVVLYRMTTGRLPFDGKSVTAILKALATVTPPPVQSIRSDVPAGLSDLIEQLLSKERDARPASAVEVSRALASLAQRSPVVPRPGLGSPTTEPSSRPRGETRNASHGMTRLRWWVGFAAAVVFGVIVIKLKDKDGKETKITLDVPPGTNLVSVEQTPDDAGGRRTRESSDPSLTTSATKPAENHKPAPFVTLDKLDSRQIPASERIGGQPEELVAVIGEQRLRHWNYVVQIAFHPSGSFFVTLAERGDLPGWHVWSTKTLESLDGAIDPNVLKTLKVGERPSAGFSPDGRWLWSELQSAIVEFNATGTPSFRLGVSRLRHKLKDYLQTVISPDGRWLAMTGSPAGVLEIWDISKPIPKLEKEISFPATGYSNVLMLSADGRRMMTDSWGAGSDARLFLWDLDWSAEGGPAVVPLGEPIPGTHGALSADGQRLVTTLFNSGKFKVLNLTQSPPLLEFEGNGREPFAFSPDGHWLAVNKDSSVDLYERASESWIRRQTLASAQANLLSMTFSPDGKILVAGDISGRLHVWDMSANPPVERLPAPPASRVQKLAFSPDGHFLAVQGWDGGTVWNVSGDVPERLTFTEPTGGVNCPPSFSPDSGMVAFVGGVWNLKTNPPSKCLERHRGSLRLSPLDNTIVSVQGTNQLLFEEWTATDKGAFRTTRGIRQWKPERPNTKADACHGLSTLQFSGQRTVLDDTQGNIEVWSLDNDQEPLVSVKFSNPSGYRLSPDGNRLFVWDHNFGAVWDLKNDPPTETRFRLTGDYTNDACFTTDGQYILTADRRGVAIYDWQFGREHRRINYPARTVALALHPDGRHVATANGNGTVYILRVPELAKRSDSEK